MLLTFKDRKGCLLAVIGLFFLLTAWPLALVFPYRGHLDFALAKIVLPITGIVIFSLWALRSGLPRGTLLRYVLVLSLFTLSFLPLVSTDSALHTAQLMSLFAFCLFMAGLLRWQGLHEPIARVGRASEAITRIPRRVFLAGMFALFLGVTVFLSWYCFDFKPIYTDTEAQFVHAKAFVAGHLYNTAPPMPQFFHVPMSIVDGAKWYSQYQPLHIGLLALGILAHAPWLVNPLEGALTLLVIYAIARRAYGESAARLAAALTLLSPFILFMSSEYMNHASALLFTSCFILCYMEMLDTIAQNENKGILWTLGAGLSLGLVFLTRPLTSVGVGLAFALYALYLIWRNPRLYLMPFFIMGGAAMLCVVFQEWYNLQLTGDIWTFPYFKYAHGSIGGSMGIGRLSSAGTGPYKAAEEWSRLNTQFFDWFVPCSLFIALACLTPLKDRFTRLLAAMLACYTAVNMANHFGSGTFGPRYMYETAPAFILLSVSGLQRLPRLLRSWGVIVPARPVMRGMIAIALSLIFISGWPFLFTHDLHRYSDRYFDSHPKFYYLLIEQSKPPALIFVAKPLKPARRKWDIFARYHVFASTNPPMDDAPRIFALDLGTAKNSKLAVLYPGRQIYLERDMQLYPVNRDTFYSDAPGQEP